MNTRNLGNRHPFLDLPADFLPDRWSEIFAMQPNERRVVAELDGPGCIRHIHMVGHRGPGLNRNAVVRIYWDGEPEPSVEAPLSDLFGICHGLVYYPINCRYLSVQHQSGYNCYFAMPFAKSARLEIITGPREPGMFFCSIDWHRYQDTELEEPLRFHAKWRREYPAQAYGEEYQILDAVGRGRLLGFVYGLRLYDDVTRWSHGGAENIHIDGDGAPALIRGTGGEDTFGTSYGGVLHTPESHLYAGMPYYVHEDVGGPKAMHRLAAYRFYEEDAIPFKRSLHFRFGCVANDICSTAYWYQDEPHREFFRMPPWERMAPGTDLKRGECDIPDASGGAWWLCGPFENAGDRAMTTELPAEREFSPTASYEGDFSDTSEWRHGYGPDALHGTRWIERREIHGFVDFSHVFRPRAYGVAVCWPAAAVALTHLRVESDCNATLRLSWDDELNLRVNGKALLEREAHRAFRTRDIPVRLRAGANEVLVKLSNTAGTTRGAWCFAFRAQRDDGSIIKPEMDAVGH